jgi:hypothetical protein
MAAPVSPALPPLPTSSCAALFLPMSFHPSVEKLPEVDEPRAAHFRVCRLAQSQTPSSCLHGPVADPSPALSMFNALYFHTRCLQCILTSSQNNAQPPVTRGPPLVHTDQIAVPTTIVVSDAVAHLSQAHLPTSLCQAAPSPSVRC